MLPNACEECAKLRQELNNALDEVQELRRVMGSLDAALSVLMNAYEVWLRGTHVGLSEQNIQEMLEKAQAFQQGREALALSKSLRGESRKE